MDFYKIFKALNSAQSSWQVSLAIIFGMISGFLPLFTVLNIFILFIVFSLNIPIAIFILSTALFGSFAILLDPTFASLGYDILNNPSLKQLFTSMYNYAPTLWSSFNHTLVMGSFVIAIVSFIPAYILFKILVDKYRVLFEKLFKNSKYFSWLNPFDEKKISKKPGIFRVSGFLFISAIYGLIIAFTLLLIDPILRFTLEFALNKASKQDIYVSSVSTDFTKATLNIENIIVKSNSSKPNDIKIDNVLFDFNAKNLLHKKVDITTLSFTNILLKTSAKIKDKTTASSTINNLSNDIKSSDLLNTNSAKSNLELPKVNDILEKENLQSLKQAKIIQKDINNILNKYKNYSKNELSKDKFNAIKNRISSLSKNIKNIKNQKDIKNILEQSKILNKDVKAYKNEIKDISTQYETDKKLIQKHLKTLKTLPNEEFNYLKNKYTFNQDGAINFIGTYISASAKEYINLALEYYEITKPYISSEEETIEEKRLNGRYIHFNDKSNLPTFVIHKLTANVDINTYESKVLINNISSNPKQLNKLITLKAQSQNKRYTLASLDMVHNALKKIQTTNIDFKVNALKNSTYKASKELSLKDSILDIRLNSSIIDFKTVKAFGTTKVIKTNIIYKSNGSKVNNTIKSILKDINSFDINAKINGDIKKPSIRINSDIDKKISKGLKSALNKELKKFQAKLKTQISKKFKDELGSNISKKDFENIEKLLSTYNLNSSIGSNISKISSGSLFKELKKKKENEIRAKLKKEIDKKKALKAKKEAQLKAKIQKEIDKKIALKKKKEKEAKDKARKALEKKLKSFF